MAEKTIVVDGRQVRLRATAAVPRLYRIKFGRDILKDILLLKTAYLAAVGKATEAKQVTDKQAARFFEVADLEVFENVAYIMARHGNPEAVPEDVDQWLEQFATFSIYQVLPDVLLLWVENEQTTAESKKKLEAVAEN